MLTRTQIALTCKLQVNFKNIYWSKIDQSWNKINKLYTDY